MSIRVVGTDEAGYGPNLGPLVVVATTWRGPDHVSLADACAPLRLTDAASSAAAAFSWIADSKRVFRRSDGLGPLEQCALAALAETVSRPSHEHSGPASRKVPFRATDWRSFWGEIDPEFVEHWDRLPWYACDGDSVPAVASPQAIGDRARQFRLAMQQTGWSLEEVDCRVIAAREFNAGLDRCGNKAELLAEATLGLVVQQLADRQALPDDHAGCGQRPGGESVQSVAEPADVLVLCDRLGGRKKYAGLLQHAWPDAWFHVVDETGHCSVYRRTGPQGAMEVRFTVGGEQYLPSALASMIAKYLRELAMRAFNAFWQQRVTGLRETAGYPVDAGRFFARIRDCCREHGWQDHLLWRRR